MRVFGIEDSEELRQMSDVGGRGGLANRMHAQLRCTDVDRGEAELGRYNRSDGRAACAVVLHQKVLHWNLGDTRSLTQYARRH